MNTTFWGYPFTQEYQAKCIFVMSYIALCPGLSKSYKEKRGRSQIVQGVSLSEHTSGERGNAHGHHNTIQGTAEHTAIRRVGTGEGICVFQLGHVWPFFFFGSSPQCPCKDLGQSQVPEGFSGTEVAVWVYPSHISFALSCEYFQIYFTLP